MEDRQISYGLFILLRDRQESLLVCETSDFSEIKTKWHELTELWAECIEKQKPFKLEEPRLTAFDPGLIKEITIHAADATSKVDQSNPYKKNMVNKGFTESLKNNSTYPDLLDNGYKLN